MKTIAKAIEEQINVAQEIQKESERIFLDFNITEDSEVEYEGIEYFFFLPKYAILVYEGNRKIKGKEKLELLREVVR